MHKDPFFFQYSTVYGWSWMMHIYTVNGGCSGNAPAHSISSVFRDSGHNSTWSTKDILWLKRNIAEMVFNLEISQGPLYILRLRSKVFAGTTLCLYLTKNVCLDFFSKTLAVSYFSPHESHCDATAS